MVEDDPNVMAVTSLLLEDAGYEVLQAASAETALDLADQRRDIDVLFTDVNLREGHNGIELARLMRQRGNHASVVIVSGDLGWAGTVPDAHMRFLAKPFGRTALLNAVASACADRDGGRTQGGRSLST
ncbi:response regulator [Fulvimonas sp. R45]|uniref:response regulator n=1 Tax=Fulvimonas sp. R45 TaxID=3045937 RepID=UPI00265F9E16|nr:response regulator [Fulvimonas sp. R45]MDO1527244.1 response regulator [Fulvimonas sp. R45]